MNQTENKNGTTRANMSRETNEGVIMCCKKITANLLTIVDLLVEPGTSLSKPKDSLDASISISQYP